MIDVVKKIVFIKNYQNRNFVRFWNFISDLLKQKEEDFTEKKQYELYLKIWPSF